MLTHLFLVLYLLRIFPRFQVIPPVLPLHTYAISLLLVSQPWVFIQDYPTALPAFLSISWSIYSLFWLFFMCRVFTLSPLSLTLFLHTLKLNLPQPLMLTLSLPLPDTSVVILHFIHILSSSIVSCCVILMLHVLFASVDTMHGSRETGKKPEMDLRQTLECCLLIMRSLGWQSIVQIPYHYCDSLW